MCVFLKCWVSLNSVGVKVGETKGKPIERFIRNRLSERLGKVSGGRKKEADRKTDIFMHPSSGTLVDHRSLVDCTARRQNRTTIRR